MLIDILKCKENQEEHKLRKEIEALKRENKAIKESVMASSVKGPSKFSKVSFETHRESTIFSCFNKPTDDNFTLSISNNIFK